MSWNDSHTVAGGFDATVPWKVLLDGHREVLPGAVCLSKHGRNRRDDSERDG